MKKYIIFDKFTNMLLQDISVNNKPYFTCNCDKAYLFDTRSSAKQVIKQFKLEGCVAIEY